MANEYEINPNNGGGGGGGNSSNDQQQQHGQTTISNQRTKIKKHRLPVERSTSEIVRTYRKRFDSSNDDDDDDDYDDVDGRQKRCMKISIITDDNDNNTIRMTNRPPNSRWKQQRLPAWQPMLKPTSVFISFIIFGLLCIVIGVIMYITNEKIREYIIDYTDCRRMNPVTGLNQSEYCRDRWKYQWDSCQCLLNFTITEPIDGPLFLYYSLDGFYQNHRRYVASIDHRQLMGEQCSLTSIRSNCYPYSDINGTIIAPCGAIANSMFSDTFQLRRIIVDNKNQYEKIYIWQKDICWPTDRQNLYRNPSNGFDSYAKPVNWSKNFYDDIILNDNNVAGHGYLNEHFMVWMRPAAFPKFRKLWGRIDVRSSIGKKRRRQ
ncbi:Cell cycle control protein 50A [Dermatophagoides farinae]|uniref:Cell cycle control protein 50A n=1 Tax=Dermatophagoides farinae TaxID=6954 RepID=A0A922L0N0_DERFA|nr:Cell cycle control protein 50A [Dermatophagoides farinae]